jgi:Sec-independent protein secretion pathway component TatC
LTIYTPRLEDTFGLYKSLLLSMVAVFQIPTLVFFLALMGLVTARWLWRNAPYATLIIFIAAAVLTSSPDWWNQSIVAAPMLAMDLVSIAVAWLAAPRGRARPDSRDHLRLVFAATVIDQLRRQQSKRAFENRVSRT